MAKKKATSKKSVAKTTVKAEKATVKSVKKVESTAKIASSSVSLLDRISQPKVLASLAAEFVGTFLLTAIILASSGQPLALIFGLMAIVLIVGNVSGAHVNPLITVGAWATKRIGHFKMLGYIIAQLLGAMLAFVVLKAFVDAAPAVSQEALYYGETAASLFTASKIPAGYEWGILLAELLGSFIFAFAVAHVTADKKHNSTSVALGVGGGLFVAVMIASSAANMLKGSSILNPAAAIALQAFTVKETNTLWAIAIYVGAALIGGLAGFGFSELLRKNSEK